MLIFIKGCAPSHDSKIYVGSEAVNTQINEQQNSTTKHLTRQLSYMTPENFVKHLRFFMWFKNEEKREKDEEKRKKDEEKRKKGLVV